MNIGISFLGFGFVCNQVAKYLLEESSTLKDVYDIEFSIRKIFVKDITKKRNIDLPNTVYTNDPMDIINDTETNIIFEGLPGSTAELTAKYVIEALKTKKSVIMASKKALARFGPKILKAAAENKTTVKFDATVGGGIPITKILANSYGFDKITKIEGILNATSNYVYTLMNEGTDYRFAIKDAQDSGYAEYDPSEDIDGYDALAKLIILGGITTGKWINYEKAVTTSFRSITTKEMLISFLSNNLIKPMARLEIVNDELLYYVGPCIMDRKNSFSLAKGINCKVRITSENTATMGYCGAGAGKEATASAMMEDFMNLINEDFKLTHRMEHLFKNIKEVEGKDLKTSSQMYFIESGQDFKTIFGDLSYRVIRREVLDCKLFYIVEVSNAKEEDLKSIEKRIDIYNKTNIPMKIQAIIPFIKQ